jgi:hypothetical protein
MLSTYALLAASVAFTGVGTVTVPEKVAALAITVPVRVGLPANTRAPVPVSSEMMPASSDDEVAAWTFSLSVVTTSVLLLGIVVKLMVVIPARVVDVPPRAIAVEPIVTEVLASFALAIEPASIVLVTVPESADVISVLVPAGTVTVPEAAAAVTRVVVPDEEPARVNPAEPIAGLTRVRPETLVVVPPSVSVLEPRVTALLANLALAIEPASIVLVTVAESPVVTTVPVVAGRVIVVVPAAAEATTVVVPEVEPLNAAPVPPIVGRVSVTPAKVDTVEPRETDVEPIVTAEFESFALAIEPASIVLVTVAESAEVIRVLVPAGTVTVPEAVAEVTIEVVPEDEPAIVRPPEPTAGVVRIGDVRVTPAKVATVEPSETEVEPIVTEEFANLALAIEPVSMLLVTVPVSPVVTTVPVMAGRVIVVVPAVALATTVVVPEVEPLNAAPVPPIVGKDSVRPETLVVVEPRVRVLEPRVIVELASFALAIAAPDAISALTMAPEMATLSHAVPSYM